MKSATSKFLVLLCTVCLVSLVPAGFQKSVAYGKAKTRILTDMLGRKLEVPEPLTRVALLGGPTGQIAYILGARLISACWLRRLPEIWITRVPP